MCAWDQTTLGHTDPMETAGCSADCSLVGHLVWWLRSSALLQREGKARWRRHWDVQKLRAHSAGPSLSSLWSGQGQSCQQDSPRSSKNLQDPFDPFSHGMYLDERRESGFATSTKGIWSALDKDSWCWTCEFQQAQFHDQGTSLSKKRCGCSGMLRHYISIPVTWSATPLTSSVLKVLSQAEKIQKLHLKFGRSYQADVKISHYEPDGHAGRVAAYNAWYGHWHGPGIGMGRWTMVDRPSLAAGGVRRPARSFCCCCSGGDEGRDTRDIQGSWMITEDDVLCQFVGFCPPSFARSKWLQEFVRKPMLLGFMGARAPRSRGSHSRTPLVELVWNLNFCSDWTSQFCEPPTLVFDLSPPAQINREILHHTDGWMMNA